MKKEMKKEKGKEHKKKGPWENTWIESVYSIGKINKSRSKILCISLEGCPYRGSKTCLSCPLASQVAPLENGDACNYKCNWRPQRGFDRSLIYCPNFDSCPCSKDQTEYLRERGLIE